MTSALLAHLERRLPQLSAAEHNGFEGIAIDPFCDHWLLASALQKAIRRNQPKTAIDAALVLLKRDPSRLWRRLLVCAFEDIGIGDITVAADLMAVASLPKARRMLGGNERAVQLVLPYACRAIKDRTADHCLSIIRWISQAPPPGPSSIEGLSRLTVTFSKGQDGKMNSIMGTGAYPSWWWRLSEAFQRMHDWQEGATDLDQLLGEYAERGVGLAWIEGAQYYALRIRDGLFCFALEACCWWQEVRREDVALTRSGLLGEDLGGYPDYGLDPLRTRLGARAVELWLRSYLTKLPFSGRQISAALWNAESARCASNRFWSLGEELQEAAYAADIARHGLAHSGQAPLWVWLRREQIKLASVRRIVWQSYQGARDPREQGAAILPVAPAFITGAP